MASTVNLKIFPIKPPPPKQHRPTTSMMHLYHLHYTGSEACVQCCKLQINHAMLLEPHASLYSVKAVIYGAFQSFLPASSIYTALELHSAAFGEALGSQTDAHNLFTF